MSPKHRNKKHHGLHDSKEHRVWAGMINRCYCKTSGSYKNYGARGIKVCDSWNESFLNFLNDMGQAPPNTQLDRINNNGDYEKSNCRWVSRSVNTRNTRASRILEFKGESKNLIAWAEQFNIPRATLERRIDKYGYSIEEAITAPVMTKEEVRAYATKMKKQKANQNTKEQK